MRSLLAENICQGLSGWFQFQVSTGLHDLFGEDSAQLVIANLVASTGTFVPLASAKPPNWTDTRKRVDIGLVGRYARPSEDGHYPSWHGAIEVKWLGRSTNTVIVRGSLLADLVRLTSISTNNLSAKFLVVGGFKEKFDEIFDRDKSSRTKTAEQRRVFSSILKEKSKDPFGQAEIDDVFECFANTYYATPDAQRPHPKSSVSAELLAKRTIKAKTFAGTQIDGQFMVWQCNKVPGRRRSE